MVCFARKLNSNQLSNIHPSVHPDNSMEENNILAPAEEQNVKDDVSLFNNNSICLHISTIY